MSTPTQEELDEAILELTGRPEWDIIVKGLQNDIYNLQAAALEAPDWDTVCWSKGFAQGLAFVINLRDSLRRVQEIEGSK